MLRRASIDVGATRREVVGSRKQLLRPPPAALRSGRQDEPFTPTPSGWKGVMHICSKSFVKFFSQLNTVAAETDAPSPPSDRFIDDSPHAPGSSSSESECSSPMDADAHASSPPSARGRSSSDPSVNFFPQEPRKSAPAELRLRRRASDEKITPPLFLTGMDSGAVSAPSTPTSLSPPFRRRLSQERTIQLLTLQAGHAPRPQLANRRGSCDSYDAIARRAGMEREEEPMEVSWLQQSCTSDLRRGSTPARSSSGEGEDRVLDGPASGEKGYKGPRREPGAKLSRAESWVIRETVARRRWSTKSW